LTVLSPSSHIFHHRKAKSLGDVKALLLVLQTQFSSFDGFETTNVVSKFWVDPNKMEEDVSDTGEVIVCTKENQEDHLRELIYPKKLLRQFSLQSRNEGLFIFLEC